MPHREKSFSLMELMIASTIGLVIVSALSYILVSNISSRNELEKNSRQIENGRYALSTLVEDIQLAGFYGEYFPSTTGQTMPDPCTTILQDMGFGDALYRCNTGATAQVPTGIFGYADTATPPSTCNSFITNRLSGTDILVIRRTHTTPINIDTDNNNAVNTPVTLENGTTTTAYTNLGNAYYLQASNCSETGSVAEFGFIFDHDTTRYTLHRAMQGGSPLSCMTGALSSLRKYVVRIFYISSCNDCTGSGDGIPTLKMAELAPHPSICTADTTSACGSMTTRAIAEGIENLQLEYGVDTTVPGDGVPDTFIAAPSGTQWENTMSVKIFLLARNTEKSVGYLDNKTYVLNSAGTLTVAPADEYKRHLYTATARAINIAGRRP
jgi:type IV pilus assembly protein PilW